MAGYPPNPGSGYPYGGAGGYGAPPPPYGSSPAPSAPPYGAKPPKEGKTSSSSAPYYGGGGGYGAPPSTQPYGSGGGYGAPPSSQPYGAPYGAPPPSSAPYGAPGGYGSPFASLVPSAFPPGTDPNVMQEEERRGLLWGVQLLKQFVNDIFNTRFGWRVGMKRLPARRLHSGKQREQNKQISHPYRYAEEVKAEAEGVRGGSSCAMAADGDSSSPSPGGRGGTPNFKMIRRCSLSLSTAISSGKPECYLAMEELGAAPAPRDWAPPPQFRKQGDELRRRLAGESYSFK
uniref:Uncharacterized protein n=1 Tax=Oryza glumipatula TaxID=40148 RepID=A0A0E0BNN7_9ORYZ